MNVNTGKVYETYHTALAEGERMEDLVEIRGSEVNIKNVSDAIKANNKARNKRKRKAQRAARRKNR